MTLDKTLFKDLLTLIYQYIMWIPEAKHEALPKLNLTMKPFCTIPMKAT